MLCKSAKYRRGTQVNDDVRALSVDWLAGYKSVSSEEYPIDRGRIVSSRGIDVGHQHEQGGDERGEERAGSAAPAGAAPVAPVAPLELPREPLPAKGTWKP